MRTLLLLAAALSAACSGGAGPRPATTAATTTPTDSTTSGEPAPVKPAAAARVRTLTADETITSPSGATFTASSAWKVEEHTDRIVLTAPEGDLTASFVELAAADRDAAITAAWAALRPGFDLAVAQAVDLPPRDGWDAVAQFVYVTPTAEQRVVVAIARKKGATWYVALVDGKTATLERRGAQLGTAVESFKVPGLDKESFAGRTAHTLDAARLAELEAFIEQARVDAGVPGAAIAIVQGGKIVYEKGFGVRELGKKGAVTPNTRFIIGSIGKSLTTLMMARVVEAGTFDWETPVIDVLPSFALGDEATTRAARMRHTTCACTGMPRQDLEFVFEGKTPPEERLASMATMKPTTKFGETFQYSNLMVVAGGFAAAHAYAPKLKLGPAYDRAMRELVFEPLGMKASTYDFKAIARTEHASPHPVDLHGEAKPVPIAHELWVHPIRPAGGLWSTVHDMAQVLLLELGRGELAGKRIVGEAPLLARRQPQVKITDEQSYGLGLMISTSLGITVVEHSGGTGGFGSNMFFLPDHDVGMIILTNRAGGGRLTRAVTRRLLELLFDGRPEAAADLASTLALQKAQRAAQLKRITSPPPTDWFAPFIGTWRAPGLGTIALRAEKRGAVLDAGEWDVLLGQQTEPDGTVMLVSVSGLAAGVELLPQQQGGATVLVLDDGQHSYVFEKTK